MKLDIIVKITNNGIKIPSQYNQMKQKIFDYCIKNRGSYVRLIISPPFKHRSTGPGSQNHHINGHCQQIANETGEDFDEIKRHAKMKAISRGYPYKENIFGEVTPLSETEIDSEQAGSLIDTLHEIAAFLGVELQEE